MNPNPPDSIQDLSTSALSWLHDIICQRLWRLCALFSFPILWLVWRCLCGNPPGPAIPGNRTSQRMISSSHACHANIVSDICVGCNEDGHLILQLSAWLHRHSLVPEINLPCHSIQLVRKDMIESARRSVEYFGTTPSLFLLAPGFVHTSLSLSFGTFGCCRSMRDWNSDMTEHMPSRRLPPSRPQACTALWLI